MTDQMLSMLLSNGGNITLNLSAKDLAEVVHRMMHDERKRIDDEIARHREAPTLTRKEAAEMLGVALSSLWRWEKSGELMPVKIGRKVMYRPSDIDEILQRKTKPYTK